MQYKSQTAVALQSGTAFHELGHVIGLAAVIARFIEVYAKADKETVKLIAELIMKNAIEDVERNKSGGVSAQQQKQITDQARAAIKQILLPLVELQTVQ